MLIENGASMNVPEKYLKTKITPAQRLQNDGSVEALQFLEELTNLTTNREENSSRSKKVKREDDNVPPPPGDGSSRASKRSRKGEQSK